MFIEYKIALISYLNVDSVIQLMSLFVLLIALFQETCLQTKTMVVIKNNLKLVKNICNAFPSPKIGKIKKATISVQCVYI